MPVNPLLGYTLAQNGDSLSSQASNALSSGAASSPSRTDFRYPLAIMDDKTDYLKIKIFDYVKPNEGSFKVSSSAPYLAVENYTERLNKSQEKSRYTIILPIPQSISDSTSVTWGEDNISPMEAYGLAVAGQGQTDPLKAATDAAGAILGELKGIDSSTQSVIKNAISGRAVNGLGGNVSVTGLISRATGQILNSNLELLFQGVNLRSFPFSFDFAPRSQKESQEVLDIIRVLKKSMIPRAGSSSGTSSGTGSGLFISAPSAFKLSYMSGGRRHPFLNAFKPCALSSMLVNYTGSGTYATYADGTPVHIQVSLDFKEINPVYLDDYETAEGKIGVGY